MKKVIFIVGLLAVVAGASIYIFKQYKRVMNYAYRFINLKILDIKKEFIRITVDLQVKNKSDITVTLQGYDFKAYINSVYVSDIILINQNVQIKPNAVTTIPLEITFDPRKLTIKDFVNWIISGVKDLSLLKLKISGYISVGYKKMNLLKSPIIIERTFKQIIETKPSDEVWE